MDAGWYRGVPEMATLDDASPIAEAFDTEPPVPVEATGQVAQYALNERNGERIPPRSRTL